MHIGFENGFRLVALVGGLLAHSHDRPERLHVVPIAPCFEVDILDVVADRLLFFLQSLDALDDRAQLILGELCRRRF